MAKGDKLTDKQEMFCRQYVIDLNATQAAIRAGYSKKTANEIGCENLAKPNIQSRIQALNKKRFDKLEITSEEIIKELKRIGFSDIRKFYKEDGTLKNPTELDDECAAALAGLEVEEILQGGDRIHIGYAKKIKTNDKLKALEMLGRHIGFFEKDNKQQSDNITPVIQVYNTGPNLANSEQDVK